MSLFAKFQPLMQDRHNLLGQGIDPFGAPIEEIYSATEARINGRRTILAGTNNYLGLTFDAASLSAAHAALDELGTGTTGSRMANGSFAGHRALEQEIAAFYGCAQAIVFTTGYQANLAVISGLTNNEDAILIDADSHASIYDGCRLSGADILRFRHNNPEDLDRRLRRLGARATTTLVIIEGIYSMLGDKARIREIIEVKNTHGAMLLVDEAHSLGVLGERGRGLVEEAGVIDDADFIAGTFSKSLASTGGYCVSNHPQLELIRYASRPYIFTASPCPSVIASTRAALQRVAHGGDLRARLWRHARRLYQHLLDAGYTLGPEPCPVIAALLDTREQALALWRGLHEHGVYVNLIFPPATPDGKSLVRISVSAAHTDEQIDKICAAFSTLAPDYR
ncbi:MAG: aminotransferase class I/II-fold pyridoxal phosphate-dependent enzyme [Gammaproteobacteria bacterium]|nr:aminotransferase class I/II-fold pyridoxal phosphate-dependent enzyme [Gammaproteobacteria bacterium]